MSVQILLAHLGTMADAVIMSSLDAHPLSEENTRISLHAMALLAPHEARQLGVLANLGDAVITKAIARRMVIMGGFSRAEFSSVRTEVTANPVLGRLLVQTGLSKLCHFVATAGPTTKAGADAFEAIIGVVSFSLNDTEMDRLLWHMGLYADTTVVRMRESGLHI